MNKSSFDCNLLAEIEGGSIVCPICKGALAARDCESALACGTCSKEFEVKDGIPIFADILLLDSFKSTESTFHSSIAIEACDAHCLYTLRVRNLHQHIIGPILSSTSEGSRVLEVAIGPGYDMVVLTKQGRKVFGIDIAHAMCSEALRHTSDYPLKDRRVIVQGDAEALPFPDEEFEAAICVASLHHFPQPIEALREINRVLQPGGIVSIGSEPNKWPYRFKRLKHSWIVKRLLRLFRDDYTIEGGSVADFETCGFEEAELRQLAKEAGFNVREITPCWYTAGFLSLFGFRPPETLERASLRIDESIARIPIARRFCWKWNMVLCKSSRR